MTNEEISKMTSQDLARLIIDWLNCHFTRQASTEFVETIMSQHMTLQQAFVSFCWTFLLRYGKEAKFFDGRNERAVYLCRQLVEKVENKELPGTLPTI